ncbi:uncharacterized protein [Maniola hyperantus]|uniref:uncharacterized protein isoform X4 n=1 Tax=Aphantopus hyperantus TaxID=2795564 RepID=UPI003747F17A
MFGLSVKFRASRCVFTIVNRCFGGELENKYSELQKEKILKVMNEDISLLSRYEITKARLKNFTTWVQKNGQIKNLSDIKTIDGFTKKNSEKLFDSIINGPPKNDQNLSKKIKGQVLHPHLTETLRQAWDITNQLPTADIYVMKAEATSLRASGSDPNNPKVLGVNLQKAQLVAMIVALINAKNSFYVDGANEESSEKLEFKQKVYFLRPTLPFRLYGTLVGNERVSTDQTVETLLQEVKNRESNSQVYVPDKLITMFRNQKELQKDMLGQCLLLALTFMDVCIYLNKDSINKLLKRGE